MNRIITISREYGAGGHSIGRRVAEELGIPFYDRDIVKQTVKASGYDLVCQDLLEVLVVRLMRRTDFSLTPTTPGTRTSKECTAVRRYIDSHFKESLSLDVLAEVAHVNKYYLVHTFSKEFGISPINYLISRRIAESKQLLSDTDHSLSQISHMLGFSSPSYFSQSFRKLEGVSPMEYRRQSKLQRASS